MILSENQVNLGFMIFIRGFFFISCKNFRLIEGCLHSLFFTLEKKLDSKVSMVIEMLRHDYKLHRKKKGEK